MSWKCGKENVFKLTVYMLIYFKKSNVYVYCQTSEISCALICNKIFDQSDVVGASPTTLRCSWSIACRRCSNYIFILDSTPGFIRLGKGNCKMRQETFKFWDLVWLILEIWLYFTSFVLRELAYPCWQAIKFSSLIVFVDVTIYIKVGHRSTHC